MSAGSATTTSTSSSSPSPSSSLVAIADFEYRLHLVEQQLGLDDNDDLNDDPAAADNNSQLTITKAEEDELGVNNANNTTTIDRDSRVTNLEQKLNNALVFNNTPTTSSSSKAQTSSTSTLQLRQTITEIQELLSELDPGTALTHQQQIVAPILYRRLELLSNKDDFLKDLNEASNILNLLMIGQESTTTSATTSTSTTAGDTKAKASSKKKISVLEERQVTQAPILIGTTSEGYLDDDMKQRMAKVETELLDMTQRSTTVMSKLENIIDQYHSTMQAISEKTIQLDGMIKIREREQRRQQQQQQQQ